MDGGSITLYALIILVVNGGVQWIREWKKYRVWRLNGADLKDIKDKLNLVDKKVGETKAIVNEQKEQCNKTVTRFDKTISDQNRELIRMAGRKR